MKSIVKFIRSEPAFLLTLVAALVSLGVSFGLKLTADQEKAVYTFVAALTAAIIRQMVVPVTSLPPSSGGPNGTGT